MEIQRKFLTLGQSGCYYLCLWKIAELADRAMYHDPIVLFDRGLDHGYLLEDCFVQDPPGVLWLATGRRWRVRKEGPDYQERPGEYVVIRYERKVPMKTLAHFVLKIGSSDTDIWDPLGESETVKYGYVASKRILWEEG
jgi:hypothetical protein